MPASSRSMASRHRMQSGLQGTAARRFKPISSPQARQTPNVPSSMRCRAARMSRITSESRLRLAKASSHSPLWEVSSRVSAHFSAEIWRQFCISLCAVSACSASNTFLKRCSFPRVMGHLSLVDSIRRSLDYVWCALRCPYCPATRIMPFLKYPDEAAALSAGYQ